MSIYGICIIKALFVKFFIYSNRNVTNRTRGSPKLLTKATKNNMTGKRCALSSLLKKYLFSHSLLKAQHSASTFLCFVNIARLLKINKYMLNDHH